MDTSSDDSFAWTNASSDDSDTMAVTDKVNDYEDESDSGKKFKKKLQKELLLDTKTPSKVNSKKNEYLHSDSETDFKEKHVKLEPDSDIDRQKKKKKKSKHKSLNGTSSETEELNKYLDVRVKQEQLSTSTFKKPKITNGLSIDEPMEDESITNDLKKKSKNKKSLEVTTTSQESDNNQSSENKEHRRKKKKSKKQKHRSEELEPLILIDKFSADETVVEKPQKKKRKKHDKNSFNELQTDTETMEVDYIDTNEIINISSSIYDDNMDTEKNARDIRKDTDKYKDTKRNTRVSDRITFEEDNDLEIDAAINMSEGENSRTEDTLTLGQSALYRNFLKVNQLQQIPVQYKNEYLIHKDDEILWLVKCPQEVEVKSLKNVDIKLENKCKLKIEGQTYEGHIDSETNRLALLTSINNRLIIQNRKVNGVIQLHKRIPKPHYFVDNIITNNQTDFIPLPETKCRHPLFGPDYKKAIQISSTIEERLNNPVIEVMHKTKKKKKKDKHHKMKTEMKSELYSQEEDSVKHKKSRKRKHDVEDTPKTKKVKRDPESAEAWESEKAIEENLFDF